MNKSVSLHFLEDNVSNDAQSNQYVYTPNYYVANSQEVVLASKLVGGYQDHVLGGVIV